MKDKLLVLLLCVSVLCDFSETAGHHHYLPTNNNGAGLRITRTSGGYPYNMRNSNGQQINSTKGSMTGANFLPLKNANIAASNKTNSNPRNR